MNAGGTNLTGAATITVSGITNADKMMILIEDASSANASSELTMRFNSDSGNNYSQFGGIFVWGSTYTASNYGAQTLVNTDDITLGLLSTNAASIMSGWVDVLGGNTTGTKIFTAQGFPSAAAGGNSQRTWMTGGYYTGTSTISSVSIISSSGNFDGGKIYVYTAA